MSRKLPFLKSYRDRHGTVRHYFRKRGIKPIPLPGEYGSREFIDAYWEARETAKPRELGGKPVAPRSFGALIPLYYKSKAYTDLKPITRQTYRNVIEKIREAHGDKPVAGFKQRHVLALLEALPANEETWRKCIRLLLNLALARGWIDVHPMAGLRRSRKAKRGFIAWTDEEMDAFEAYWPSGSRERLAYALLFYTAQRRTDVVTLGRQHVRNGHIHVAQEKSNGETQLGLPIHPDLKRELDQVPATQLTFLLTQYGEPFSPGGFTNWFVERAQKAGLPEGRTPHGLRKAASRRIAENGGTGHDIMAVTGHKNLSEVTLYTASANQQRLAAGAVRKLERRTKVSNDPKPG